MQWVIYFAQPCIQAIGAGRWSNGLQLLFRQRLLQDIIGQPHMEQ